jgi:lipoprotein-releasing system ATP-binding protein
LSEKRTLLEAKGLVKSYQRQRVQIPVLKGIELTITSGRFTALVGRSGSGKSTLMHLLATLDRPDEGGVWFMGERMDQASRKRRDEFRNQEIGMIFQFYHLLPELTALENVLSPTMIGHGFWSYTKRRTQLRRHAEELLEKVGLTHRAKHLPHQMSGGEMQRTAIARALINRPRILLADEPTGNLDAQTGGEIMSLLHRLVQEEGLTVVMVTHDEAIAQGAHRLISMVNGRIEDQGKRKAG